MLFELLVNFDHWREQIGYTSMRTKFHKLPRPTLHYTSVLPDVPSVDYNSSELALDEACKLDPQLVWYDTAVAQQRI